MEKGVSPQAVMPQFENPGMTMSNKDRNQFGNAPCTTVWSMQQLLRSVLLCRAESSEESVGACLTSEMAADSSASSYQFSDMMYAGISLHVFGCALIFRSPHLGIGSSTILGVQPYLREILTRQPKPWKDEMG